MKPTPIVLALAALTAACGGSSTSPKPLILLANPLTWTFANTSLGLASAPKGFTVTNAGNSSTTSFADGLSGTNAADFTITADGCATAGAVAPNATCLVSVEFTPTSSVGTKNATLDVVAQPGSPSVHVTLSGVAVP